MSFVNNSAIFHPDVVDILRDHPLTVIDIGASGQLVEPWASIRDRAPDAINIVGFEPEEKECARLNRSAARIDGGTQSFLPYALWDRRCEVTLHVAEDPSTSSVHPPNWVLLDEFADKHGKPRTTANTARVAALPLDDVLAEKNVEPDFIKIDTQGSEYEILTGAKTILAQHCFGCTLETWTSAVHEGQYLAFDIMRLMDDMDFRVFDLERTAVWRRSGADRFRRSRGELVGVDFLYLKPPAAMRNASATKLLKAGLLADLWGYRAFAAQLLARVAERDPARQPQSATILGVMERLDRKVVVKPQSRFGQLKDLILPRLFPVKSSYPPIH